MASYIYSTLDSYIPQHETKSMREGATENEIEIVNKKLNPMCIPTDLRDLFMWHNGSETQFYPDFPFFGFKFYSLNEAINAYFIFKKNNETLDVDYFPIGDRDGAMILSSITSDINHQPSIHVYYFDEGIIEKLHNSIFAMIETAKYVASNDMKGKSWDDIRMVFNKT